MFVASIVAGLGTILISISANAGGLVFDGNGNLFEASGQVIFKYAPDGTKSTFGAGLMYPLGLSFDGKGSLFASGGAVTDPKSSILKFTPDGKRSTFATGISSVGMAFDRSGNLFVSQGDSIFKFTPKGIKSTFVTSKPANFMDLAFDGAGNLFVADQAVRDARVGREIFKFSHDGTKTTFATGLETSNHLAVDAMGTDALAVDGSGNVFASNDHSILKFDSSGTPSTFASDWVSPDKRWEYKCVNGVSPEIVRAGTTQVVLDVDKDLNVSRAEEAEVVWAPDSKRFALNYTAPSAAHTSYKTIALYQLRGDEWVALRSPVDESERMQLAQLVKKQLPKSAYSRSAEPVRDILKVRNWIDANTAILYAYGVWTGGSRGGEASFLFTLKFDAEGNCKIVKTHPMSKKELDEEQ